MIALILFVAAVLFAVGAALFPGQVSQSLETRVTDTSNFIQVVQDMASVRGEWSACVDATSLCIASRGIVEGQAPLVVGAVLIPIQGTSALSNAASSGCQALKTWAGNISPCAGTSHPSTALAVRYTVSGSCYKTGAFVRTDCLGGQFTVTTSFARLNPNDSVSYVHKDLTRAMNFVAKRMPAASIDAPTTTTYISGVQQ